MSERRIGRSDFHEPLVRQDTSAKKTTMYMGRRVTVGAITKNSDDSARRNITVQAYAFGRLNIFKRGLLRIAEALGIVKIIKGATAESSIAVNVNSFIKRSKLAVEQLKTAEPFVESLDDVTRVEVVRLVTAKHGKANNEALGALLKAGVDVPGIIAQHFEATGQDASWSANPKDSPYIKTDLHMDFYPRAKEDRGTSIRENPPAPSTPTMPWESDPSKVNLAELSNYLTLSGDRTLTLESLRDGEHNDAIIQRIGELIESREQAGPLLKGLAHALGLPNTTALIMLKNESKSPELPPQPPAHPTLDLRALASHFKGCPELLLPLALEALEHEPSALVTICQAGISLKEVARACIQQGSETSIYNLQQFIERATPGRSYDSAHFAYDRLSAYLESATETPTLSKLEQFIPTDKTLRSPFFRNAEQLFHKHHKSELFILFALSQNDALSAIEAIESNGALLRSTLQYYVYLKQENLLTEQQEEGILKALGKLYKNEGLHALAETELSVLVENFIPTIKEAGSVPTLALLMLSVGDIKTASVVIGEDCTLLQATLELYIEKEKNGLLSKDEGGAIINSLNALFREKQLPEKVHTLLQEQFPITVACVSANYVATLPKSSKQRYLAGLLSERCPYLISHSALVEQILTNDDVESIQILLTAEPTMAVTEELMNKLDAGFSLAQELELVEADSTLEEQSPEGQLYLLQLITNWTAINTSRSAGSSSLLNLMRALNALSPSSLAADKLMPYLTSLMQHETCNVEAVGKFSARNIPNSSGEEEFYLSALSSALAHHLRTKTGITEKESLVTIAANQIQLMCLGIIDEQAVIKALQQVYAKGTPDQIQNTIALLEAYRPLLSTEQQAALNEVTAQLAEQEGKLRSTESTATSLTEAAKANDIALFVEIAKNLSAEDYNSGEVATFFAENIAQLFPLLPEDKFQALFKLSWSEEGETSKGWLNNREDMIDAAQAALKGSDDPALFTTLASLIPTQYLVEEETLTDLIKVLKEESLFEKNPGTRKALIAALLQHLMISETVPTGIKQKDIAILTSDITAEELDSSEFRAFIRARELGCLPDDIADLLSSVPASAVAPLGQEELESLIETKIFNVQNETPSRPVDIHNSQRKAYELTKVSHAKHKTLEELQQDPKVRRSVIYVHALIFESDRFDLETFGKIHEALGVLASAIQGKVGSRGADDITPMLVEWMDKITPEAIENIYSKVTPSIPDEQYYLLKATALHTIKLFHSYRVSEKAQPLVVKLEQLNLLYQMTPEKATLTRIDELLFPDPPLDIDIFLEATQVVIKEFSKTLPQGFIKELEAKSKPIIEQAPSYLLCKRLLNNYDINPEYQPLVMQLAKYYTDYSKKPSDKTTLAEIKNILLPTTPLPPPLLTPLMQAVAEQFPALPKALITDFLEAATEHLIETGSLPPSFSNQDFIRGATESEADWKKRTGIDDGDYGDV